MELGDQSDRGQIGMEVVRAHPPPMCSNAREGLSTKTY